MFLKMFIFLDRRSSRSSAFFFNRSSRRVSPIFACVLLKTLMYLLTSSSLVVPCEICGKSST